MNVSPSGGCQGIGLNLVMHRNYQTNAPAKFKLDDITAFKAVVMDADPDAEVVGDVSEKNVAE